ncbi:MAG TPA: hypothetical protein PLQ59_07680 [Fervidobacterium sp.]|nr:hypothetical protein [Fervidobacterium sp.]
MAWTNITTGTNYTGWKTYEETLTLSSATSINTSALVNYKGNTVLSAAIKESSANLTKEANAVKVQISIDGTSWVDMKTGVTPGVTAAKTGCGMMIDLRNIIAPYYRIVITCTSYTGDVKIQYAVKE